MQIVIISSKNGSIPPISAPYSAETKNPATTFKNHLEHTITHPNRQKNSTNLQNPEQRINKTAYPDTFSHIPHERKRIPKNFFAVVHLHTFPIKVTEGFFIFYFYAPVIADKTFGIWRKSVFWIQIGDEIEFQKTS